MDCEEILKNLSLLRTRDASLHLFGASSHRYRLNEVATPTAIAAFEADHQVELPADYRGFLLHCGNGGAGPYYGLFPLGLFDGAGNGLEPWREGDGFAGVLSRPFPHTEPWNLPDSRFEVPDDLLGTDAEDKWYEILDAEYWAPNLTNGAFPICHQGCAYRNLLVVSGPERGHIWLDGRASDEGITPATSPSGGRVSFATWYAAWLDAALDGRDLT
jgi:hypothetical protein